MNSHESGCRRNGSLKKVQLAKARPPSAGITRGRNLLGYTGDAGAQEREEERDD